VVPLVIETHSSICQQKLSQLRELRFRCEKVDQRSTVRGPRSETIEQFRWLKFPRTAQLNDEQHFISETIESWTTTNGHWYWGIREVGEPALHGGVDLRDLRNTEINLSFVIFPMYRNKGFARTASVLALKYAHEILLARTAVMKMLAGNEYSTKLALSLGATFAGKQPSDAGGEFTVYKFYMAD
jgi:RimJ/RimL family protein N-acetyltransferase